MSLKKKWLNIHLLMYASNISRIRNWRELGTERTRRKDLTFHCLSSKFFEFSFFYYNHVIQTIFYKYICMCIYIFLCTYTHIPWASFHDTVCNTISIFHLLHSIPVPGAVHLLGRYCIKCWGVMRKGADRRNSWLAGRDKRRGGTSNDFRLGYVEFMMPVRHPRRDIQ